MSHVHWERKIPVHYTRDLDMRLRSWMLAEKQAKLSKAKEPKDANDKKLDKTKRKQDKQS